MNPMYRHTKTLLLCLLAIPALTSLAHSETFISTVGPGQVSELYHHREVHLGTQSAAVNEEIVLANGGAFDVEALYQFDLPKQAAVVDLKIETGRAMVSHYGVVDSNASTRLIADPDKASQPDLGLLRMIGVEDTEDGGTRRYELRVFPVPGQKSSTVRLQWHMPVAMVAGRHSIRIPERGNSKKLARSEVKLKLAMPSSQVHGGGSLVKMSSGRTATFVEPISGDLVIQASPKAAPVKAQAEVALIPLSANSGIAAIRVVVPATAAGVQPRFRRAVVVVDVSRSMGDAGRSAASKFVDGLLAELGSGTLVEAILFDRNPTPVLGDMRSASSKVRAQIVRQISTASNNNGSNLPAALAMARKTLERENPKVHTDTLLVVVSDGLFPSSLQEDDAISAYGTELLEGSRVFSAMLLPPNAPVPTRASAPLSKMAYQARGQVAALHYKEAAQKGRSLLRELTQPQPLDTITVELDRGHWFGADFANQVAPGTSMTALGYYLGERPKRVTLEGRQGDTRVQLVAKNMSKSQIKAMAQMTLANTSSDSFPGPSDSKENRRRFIAAATRFGVVTEASAGIVIDKNNAFAQGRLKMANQWGGQYYRRLPPLQERAKKHRFAAFAIATGLGRKRLGFQKTGVLGETIIRRRVRTHAIPIARRCYDRLLRGDHKVKGVAMLRFEISRGEVHQVSIPEITPALEPIAECIKEAAYSMPIPRVYQGSNPEEIHQVNYPLRFRSGKVQEDENSGSTRPDSKDDPLWGLPD